jgi:hypothetical protein
MLDEIGSSLTLYHYCAIAAAICSVFAGQATRLIAKFGFRRRLKLWPDALFGLGRDFALGIVTVTLVLQTLGPFLPTAWHVPTGYAIIQISAALTAISAAIYVAIRGWTGDNGPREIDPDDPTVCLCEHLLDQSESANWELNKGIVIRKLLRLNFENSSIENWLRSHPRNSG